MPDPIEIVRLDLQMTPRQARLVSHAWLLLQSFGMGHIGVTFKMLEDRTAREAALDQILHDWNVALTLGETLELAEQINAMSDVVLGGK